jgi:hypothetical protein
MRFRHSFTLVCLLACSSLAQSPAPATAKSATVPITLDHNRIIVDVRLPLPDGNTERVRALVDNGNPDMRITAALADKLKLSVTNEPQPAGMARAAQPPSELTIGAMQIKPRNVKCYAVPSGKSVRPGMSAEITIPSTLLRNYDVLIDYANREFTIAAPGEIRFQGAKAKANVNPENGLIHIASRIDGKNYNLGLDAGASFSLIFGKIIAALDRRHPHWPHMTGAVGPANVGGGPDEPARQLLRIPSLQYGPITLSDIGVESLAQEYMEWFEKRAGIKSVGVIGANALLNYRVGLDYAHASVYFEQTAKNRPPEMDVVGLTLRPEPDGNYTVIGIADYDNKPSVPGVSPNDVLVSIDQTLVKGGTMGQVWSLLGGSPGEERELELSRGGKKFMVKATVRRFLAAR